MRTAPVFRHASSYKEYVQGISRRYLSASSFHFVCFLPCGGMGKRTCALYVCATGVNNERVI